MVIWLLSHYGIDGKPVSDMSISLLARIGEQASLFLKPLGCAYWQIAAALCTGVMAKEAIVSTLAVTGIYDPELMDSYNCQQLWPYWCLFCYILLALLR